MNYDVNNGNDTVDEHSTGSGGDYVVTVAACELLYVIMVSERGNVKDLE